MKHRADAPVEVTTPNPAGPPVTHVPGPAATGQDPSTGQLVSQLSDEVSRLLRDELKLAQLEVTSKAKKAGIGAGMFGAAGIVALYGVGVLLAAAVLALALVIDAWLAALLVGVLLLVVAGVVALLGKKQVAEAAPPVPTEAIAGVKEDVDAVRNPGAHR